MIKTLKGKLSFIYIVIITFMSLIGLISALNLFIISNNVDGFLINNYSSIRAVNSMKDALFNQQHGIFLYLNDNKENGLKDYSKNNNLFIESLNLQENHITEKGELEYVDKLTEYYDDYSNKFFVLIDICQSDGKAEGYKFFYKEIKPCYDDIISTLNSISILNEKSMMNSQDKIENKTTFIMFFILGLTFISILISFVWSKRLLKRTLLPLNNIINAIKNVKTSAEYKELEVTTQDELGELTTQFNLMARRIKSFEESSLGSILKERNNATSILKSIDSPMIVVDNDYRVTMANDDFIKAFNIEEEKIEGKYLTHIVKDRNFFSFIYEITSNPKEGNLKNIFEYKNGEVQRYYTLSINEIKEDNSLIGKVILLKDVTNLKKVEKVSKDYFATVSHEFKTPLTSIMVGTSLLESNKLGELNEEQRKILDTIKEDGERLNSLVSNILLLSKLESSQEIYKMDYEEVNTLVETAVATNMELATYHGVILEYDINKNVIPLYCDGEKIVWVINNIIVNAIRHCEDGDLISIRSFTRDNMLNITVTDTGIGILKEHTDIIFEKYMQLNKDLKNQTGLGLWICKDIISAHNGTITCESDLGEGATFTITIPYN